jgi:predicted ATP-binding protein involved in virulence
MARLTGFKVTKLFGEFDYCLRLNDADHITAIYGRNGSGKTACLKLINALFAFDEDVFCSTPYKKLKYEFDDGTVVELETDYEAHSQADIDSNTPNVRVDEFGDIQGVYGEPPFHSSEIATSFSCPPKFHVEMSLEELGTFLDTPLKKAASRKNYTKFEIEEILNRAKTRRLSSDYDPNRQRMGRFENRFPIERFEKQAASLDETSELVAAKVKSDEEFSHFSEFHNSLTCRFIETQRLSPELEWDERRNRLRPNSLLPIQEKSKDLSARIQHSTNEYALASQERDRSFPHRLITAMRTDHHYFDVHQYKERIGSIDEMRESLAANGLLEVGYDSIEGFLAEVSDETAAVLGVYLEDVEEKLSVFNDIQNKIALFRRIIDSRFNAKNLKISRDGFNVVSEKDGRIIPLEKLSSGEQHQIILIYDMLFDIETGSLLLVDEPELSLHVGWQKRFIPDLIEILKLNQFDVVLATHSPQLIGRWQSLAIELTEMES